MRFYIEHNTFVRDNYGTFRIQKNFSQFGKFMKKPLFITNSEDVNFWKARKNL